MPLLAGPPPQIEAAPGAAQVQLPPDSGIASGRNSPASSDGAGEEIRVGDTRTTVVGNTETYYELTPEIQRSFMVAEEEICNTSYGHVRLVLFLPEKREYVMKTTDMDAVARNPTRGERPEHEGAVLRALQATIQHPSIVRLLVELRSGPLIRLILEYCENGDLFERIRHRASSESDARKWFCQVLSAVDFVHRHGFSHGDISPENVLLDANDDAKLADFGFARRHPSKGALLPPARAGKPYSLAPEVFARLPFDGRRADIYSLGTLLYMMLTGRFPYNKPDAFDTSFSLIYDGNLAKALEVARLKVPPLAADLIQRLMSPPESRPSIEDIYRHPWISAVPRSLKAQLRGA